MRLFIYNTAQLFSILENDSFRSLFNTNLISVNYFHNLLNEDYKCLLKGIQDEINKLTYAALILDEWSAKNTSFIGITTFLTGSNVNYNSTGSICAFRV